MLYKKRLYYHNTSYIKFRIIYTVQSFETMSSNLSLELRLHFVKKFKQTRLDNLILFLPSNEWTKKKKIENQSKAKIIPPSIYSGRKLEKAIRTEDKTSTHHRSFPLVSITHLLRIKRRLERNADRVREIGDADDDQREPLPLGELGHHLRPLLDQLASLD